MHNQIGVKKVGKSPRLLEWNRRNVSKAGSYYKKALEANPTHSLTIKNYLSYQKSMIPREDSARKLCEVQRELEGIFCRGWFVRRNEQPFLDAYQDWLKTLQGWNESPRRKSAIQRWHDPQPVWEIPSDGRPACFLGEMLLGSSSPLALRRQQSHVSHVTELDMDLIHAAGDPSIDPWTRYHIVILQQSSRIVAAH